MGKKNHLQRKADEWAFNRALPYFFAGHEEFMFVYSESDKRNFKETDGKNPDSDGSRSKVEALLGFPFRVDGVALDKAGRPHILEVKVSGRLSDKAAEALILQCLVYSNYLWKLSEQVGLTDKEVLGALHWAHWRGRHHFTRATRGLPAEHQDYFDRGRPVGLTMKAPPDVVLLLPLSMDLQPVQAAIEDLRTRYESLAAYRDHLVGNHSKTSQAGKMAGNRIPREFSEADWEDLKGIRFRVYPIDLLAQTLVIRDKIATY